MKIKYDRRVMRIILITAVVVSVPTLVGMICGVFLMILSVHFAML